MSAHNFWTRAFFFIVALACLTPLMSSGLALLSGIVFSLTLGNPYPTQARSIAQRLLQASVVGLGAGMNLSIIQQVGLQGLSYTFVGILFTVGIGLLLGKFMQTPANTGLLLSVGTAICGGSAIAAVSSTIRAKADEISISLATVFFLNAMALFIFPPIGHFFNLSQTQFGLWSALAIHDTSSVVGAAVEYGQGALEIATPVKLARALWIIPVCLVVGFTWQNSKTSQNKTAAKKPWFIFWFLTAAAIVTWFPSLKEAGHLVSTASKHTLVLTLFLIGSNLTRDTIRSVGLKPFVHGFFLWALTAIVTLFAILGGWINGSYN